MSAEPEDPRDRPYLVDVVLTQRLYDRIVAVLDRVGATGPDGYIGAAVEAALLRDERDPEEPGLSEE